jgi:prepilin-type processing-associated H-X9-DG protein
MPKSWQMAVALSWWNPAFESNYYNRNPRARGNEYGVGSKTFAWGPNGTYTTLGAPDSDMEDSSNTIIAFEHNARVPMCNALQTRDWYDAAPKDADLEAHFEFLHRNGANVVFGDAHTRHMDFQKFKRPMFSMRKDIYR